MENDNKLFENSTTYTRETYLDFLKFHAKKNNFSYYLYTIVWSFLLILCIVVSFESNYRLQGVIITIILICFILYRFYHPKMAVNKELESDKIGENNVNKFCFYNNNFTIENKNGKFVYKYFIFKKICSTPNYIYLYVSKENAFILSKSAFSLGNEKDFEQFIKGKCPLKYRLYNSI